jgi:hypothetical protein
MSQFTLDKVEQEILNARAAAAYGNAKEACFHLAQAIELLRSDLTADKQPAPEVGFPPPLTIMPNGYMAGSKDAPVTYSGSILSHAWGQTVNLPDPEEQHAENQRRLGMLNMLSSSETHNVSVRVAVDRLRCLCEDLVRSERIVHPSYSGVRGSGDAMALANVRVQIDRAQGHLSKLEPENGAIATFNRRISKLTETLLYRREYAERARNNHGEKWSAIEREKVIDLRLAQITSFIASDWGEEDREPAKRPWWGVLRDAFKSEDYSGPNWYKRYTPHPGPLL